MEHEIIQWIYEAARMIKDGLEETLTVDEKSGRTDLVTNMDKKVQRFFVGKINQFDPDARILGEENGQDQTPIGKGRVFVIDPIDGTLNFVMQKENFCIMIAVYEEGIGQLGFIYDVMQDQLFWGGPKVGKVFQNKEILAAPENKSLDEGLLGVNARYYRENLYHVQELGNRSMGVRLLGCAGLEFIAMLKGTQVAYVSQLCPWDYAAGIVLMRQLGMVFSGEENQPLSFQTREYFAGGTSAAMKMILDF